MIPQWPVEQAELGLHCKMVYINKPFPKDKNAQVIDINTGMVKANITRKDYNAIKKKGEYKEENLPHEEGMTDWKGIVPNERKGRLGHRRNKGE